MSAEFPPDRTRLLARREVLAGMSMLGAAAIVAARRPDIKLDYLGKKTLDDVLPAQIGRWKFVSTSGLVVPPKDQLALAIYSQTVTRVYTDGNSMIMLLAAYSASETGFLQVHRPEFCYKAAGFSLSDFAPHEIRVPGVRSFQVNTLTATRDAGGEKLFYWTRIGDRIPLSWAEQKLVFAEDNLRGLIPDAALVRVSTPLGGGPGAVSNLDEFIREMIQAIPPSLRHVLIA